MDLNLLVYTAFRTEFESGSKIGPKPTQNQILTNFRKLSFFLFFENPDLYRAAAAAARPFFISVILQMIFDHFTESNG